MSEESFNQNYVVQALVFIHKVVIKHVIIYFVPKLHYIDHNSKRGNSRILQTRHVTDQQS